ncbi:hypothetical protein [Streptomyces sp. NPDC058304]|uniref:hypothetical protein n=1 Tax=Streptomyces sp. NPDC058304 TaxID=3346437 RepID=UPI0036ECF279
MGAGREGRAGPGQVPTAGKGRHLVRVRLGELRLAAEADEVAGPDEVADRGGGHPRPAQQGLRQPVRRRPGADRSPQLRPDRLRIGATSTTARDRRPSPASAAGTGPVPVAHRQDANGTRSRLPALPARDRPRSAGVTRDGRVEG